MAIRPIVDVKVDDRGLGGIVGMERLTYVITETEALALAAGEEALALSR